MIGTDNKNTVMSVKAINWLLQNLSLQSACTARVTTCAFLEWSQIFLIIWLNSYVCFI